MSRPFSAAELVALSSSFVILICCIHFHRKLTFLCAVILFISVWNHFSTADLPGSLLKAITLSRQAACRLCHYIFLLIIQKPIKVQQPLVWNLHFSMTLFSATFDVLGLGFTAFTIFCLHGTGLFNFLCAWRKKNYQAFSAETEIFAFLTNPV